MDLAKREMTLLVVLSFSVYEFTIKVSLPLILEENLKLVQIWKLRPLYESYEAISSEYFLYNLYSRQACRNTR